jgi:hypothetical protein
MSEKRVSIPCTDLHLEGRMSLPEGSDPQPGVVVCHPHPLYGGSMDNNVVSSVCNSLQAQGLATLRFNFRGVGGSQGTHGQGVTEQDDVRAALSVLRSQEEVDENRLGLAGYSFGAGVARDVAVSEKSIAALALISMPLASGETSPLDSYDKPKLIISGSADNFISFEAVLDLVARLPEPKSHEIVPNADHFWFGHEAEAANSVTSFFIQHLRKAE